MSEPTSDQYLEMFMKNLWPYDDSQGNPEHVFDYVMRVFINIIPRKMTLASKIVDFYFIVESYQNYCEWWDNEHGDKKYIAKEDKKLSIEKFLMKSMYNNYPFAIKRKTRDHYLFGNFEKEYLEKRLSDFKDILNETKQ